MEGKFTNLKLPTETRRWFKGVAKNRHKNVDAFHRSVTQRGGTAAQLLGSALKAVAKVALPALKTGVKTAGKKLAQKAAEDAIQHGSEKLVEKITTSKPKKKKKTKKKDKSGSKKNDKPLSQYTAEEILKEHESKKDSLPKTPSSPSPSSSSSSQTGGTLQGIGANGSINAQELLRMLATQINLAQSPKAQFLNMADRRIKEIMNDPNMSNAEKIHRLTSAKDAYRKLKREALEEVPKKKKRKVESGTIGTQISPTMVSTATGNAKPTQAKIIPSPPKRKSRIPVAKHPRTPEVSREQLEQTLETMPKQKGGRAVKRRREESDSEIDEVTEEESKVTEPKRTKGPLKASVDLFSEPVIDITTKKCSKTQFAQQQQGMHPLKIKVEQSSHWIKLNDITFEFDVEFKDSNNALLQSTCKTVPVNNIGHSLIEQIVMTINGNNVEQTSTTRYYIKAYIMRLLEYGIHEKECNLTIEGYYHDEAGKINRTNPLAAIDDDYVLGGAHSAVVNAAQPTAAEVNRFVQHLASENSDVYVNNKGATKRHRLCCANRRVHFEIHPEIALLKSNRYLPPGCEIEFTIYWARPQIVFMADQNQATNHSRDPKFTIVEGSPRINIKNVMLDEQLHVQLEHELLNQQKIAKFPLMSTSLKTSTIPNGRRDYDWFNVYGRYCPNYMALCFLRGDALQGSYTEAFTNFTDRNLSSIRVTRGGEEIPLPRMSFEKFYGEEGFKALLEFTGRGLESPPIGITRESFKNGYFILLFNFNTDGEQNFAHDYDKNNGIVNIHLEFSADTADNTTVIALGLFENQAWIDGNKNYTLKHGTTQ
ncbi:hypothetical protein AC249_AIPGENE8678 [Exaiptasia diaphana]|nr:hypothetical protein AC249_AIPGENE8678 [Exaiptasia diaphana]